MMKTPTPVEIELCFAHIYDPVKAHEYYVRTRKLKGRESGGAVRGTSDPGGKIRGKDPRSGKTKEQIHKDARAKQRAELSQQIRNLELKLVKLKALIRTRSAEEDAAARKSLGKKERAAKESNKPKTVAEKAELARENKKYRDTHKQELKRKAKSESSSSKNSSNSSSTENTKRSVSDLEILAVRVQGKIAVAKTKLAAL